MNIYDYHTDGGKNVITDYIDSLPANERLMIYDIRRELRQNGVDTLKKLKTRLLRNKLWEIKVNQHRIMYVLIDSDNIAFLHICKKQKAKAEKYELEKALKRAKESGLM